MKKKCPICPKEFEKFEELIHHLELEHKGISSDLLKLATDAHETKKQLGNYVEDNSTGVGFECPHCYEMFSDLKILSDHGNKVHNVQFNPEFLKKLQVDVHLAYEFCDQLTKEFESNNEKSEKEFEKLNTAANDRRKEATIKILSYVTNLDVNYGGIIFPKEEYYSYEFKNPKKPNHIPRFHHDLRFEYLQIDYDPNNAKTTREDTVKKMYDAIEFAIESQPKPLMINT